MGCSCGKCRQLQSEQNQLKPGVLAYDSVCVCVYVSVCVCIIGILPISSQASNQLNPLIGENKSKQNAYWDIGLLCVHMCVCVNTIIAWIGRKLTRGQRGSPGRKKCICQAITAAQSKCPPANCTLRQAKSEARLTSRAKKNPSGAFHLIHPAPCQIQSGTG